MKNRMVRILVFGALVFFGSRLAAQPGSQPRPLMERLESLKIAFITEKLQLTPEESQQFWPLYNQFEADKDALRTEVIGDADPPNLNMSSSEADQFLRAYLDLKQRELDLEKEYIQKLKNLLPEQKIVLLIRVQRDFQKKILQLLRDREPPRRGNFRRPGN
jgi:hypothetical protein